MAPNFICFSLASGGILFRKKTLTESRAIGASGGIHPIKISVTSLFCSYILHEMRNIFIDSRTAQKSAMPPIEKDSPSVSDVRKSEAAVSVRASVNLTLQKICVQHLGDTIYQICFTVSLTARAIDTSNRRQKIEKNKIISCKVQGFASLQSIIILCQTCPPPPVRGPSASSSA